MNINKFPVSFSFKNMPLALSKVTMDSNVVSLYCEEVLNLPTVMVNDEKEILGAIIATSERVDGDSLLFNLRQLFSLRQKFSNDGSNTIEFKLIQNEQVFGSVVASEREMLQIFYKMQPVMEVNLFALGKFDYLTLEGTKLSQIEELKNYYGELSKLSHFWTNFNRKKNGRYPLIEVQVGKTGETTSLALNIDRVQLHFEQSVFAQAVNAFLTESVVELASKDNVHSLFNYCDLKAIFEKAQQLSRMLKS